MSTTRPRFTEGRPKAVHWHWSAVAAVVLLAVAVAPTNAQLAPWEPTLGYPERVSGQQGDVVQWANYIYCVGDRVSGDLTKLGELNPGGGVLSWSDISTPPYTIGGAGGVVHNGYIYRVGGETAATVFTSAVDYAQINPPGWAWQTTSSLARNSFQGAAVVYGDCIYSVGGSEADTVHPPTVQIAEINPDGSLENWNVSPSQMAFGHPTCGAVVHNGWLYVIGGGRHSYYRREVERCPIDAETCTLGIWVSLEYEWLPETRSGMGTVVLGDRIYVLGGHLSTYGGSPTTSVLSARINANGSLGTPGLAESAWQEREEPYLPPPAGNRAAVAVPPYIYVVTLTGPPTEVVYSFPVDLIPTVSEWGLVAMTLLVMSAGTVVLRRRRVAAT